jgi:hypothetical protein
MLIDSGANVSIISKETVQNWPYSTRPVIEAVQCSLHTVTGETSPFHGKAEIEICIGKQKILHEFLIADIKQPAIIGLDFLFKHNCDIMLSKGYITLKGERIPCFMNQKDAPVNCCRIAVTETVVIPPETEVIVEGKPLDSLSRDRDCLIESNLSFAEK